MSEETSFKKESKSLLPDEQGEETPLESKVEGNSTLISSLTYGASLLQLVFGLIAASHLLPRRVRAMPQETPVEQVIERQQSRQSIQERRLIRDREVALAREEARMNQLPWSSPIKHPHLVVRDTQAPEPREPQLQPPLRVPGMTAREHRDQILQQKVDAGDREERATAEMVSRVGQELIYALENLTPQTEENKRKVASFLDTEYVRKTDVQRLTEKLDNVDLSPESRASMVSKFERRYAYEGPPRTSRYRDILKGEDIRRLPTQYDFEVWCEVDEKGMTLLKGIAPGVGQDLQLGIKRR